MTEGYFPPQDDPNAVRIGDHERAEAMQMLHGHLTAGRMSVPDYDRRTGVLTTAQTVGELRGLFADLPAPWPRALVPVTQYPAYGQYPPPWGPGGLAAGYSDKSKLIAGLLQILVPIGIGRFYTGHVGLGIAQLAVTIVTCGLGALWPFIDGILILVNGGTDAQGRPLSA